MKNIEQTLVMVDYFFKNTPQPIIEQMIADVDAMNFEEAYVMNDINKVDYCSQLY